jgi:hypothetical protein
MCFIVVGMLPSIVFEVAQTEKRHYFVVWTIQEILGSF